MFTFFSKFRSSEFGATATEYALLVVGIALVMVVGAVLLGGELSDKFSSTGDCIGTSSGAAACNG